MGQKVINAEIARHHQSSGAVWGMTWGQNDTGDHHFHAMTQSEVATARQAAAQGQAAFRAALPQSARDWYDAQPSQARDIIYADAADSGAR